MTRITAIRLVELGAALLLTLFAIALMLSARAHAADEAGPFRLSDAWIRMPVGGSDITAGYLTIANPRDAADALIGVASPAAKSVEVHTMSMEGGVARMRRIDGPVDIPARGALTLEPAGMHLMLIGIGDPLAPDRSVPLTLTFKKAGEVKIDAPVRSGPPGSDHRH